MLKNVVWPAVSSSATRKKYWFMQDGARPHTTNDCLTFLNEKFNNRVISDRLDLFWPPKSPDLNPLDFSIWGQADNAVFKAQPSTIDELKRVVQNFLNTMSKEDLFRVTANFEKRAAFCLKLNGGHIEQILKKKK